MDTSLSVVIVAYHSALDLARTLPGLSAELLPGDEVIIVDNGSGDDLKGVVSEKLPGATIVSMGNNAGYTAAVNAGSQVASGDLLVVLNPDAKPEPGFGEAIRRPLSERPDWAAWMSLVIYQEDGRRLINSFGNPLHFTGLCWAGGHGLPEAEAGESREVPTLSGACLAVPLETWRRVGGFSDEFFLYQEDTDFSVRLRNLNEPFGLVTDAVVDHDYEFGRREQKYLWLERNRIAMLIRNYPAGLLVLVLPALIVTEAALLVVAAREGWLQGKLRSYRDLARWLPRLLRERRQIQTTRAISARAFADFLTPDLDSPFFPDIVRSRPVRFALRLYWRAVKALLS